MQWKIAAASLSVILAFNSFHNIKGTWQLNWDETGPSDKRDNLWRDNANQGQRVLSVQSLSVCPSCHCSMVTFFVWNVFEATPTHGLKAHSEWKTFPLCGESESKVCLGRLRLPKSWEFQTQTISILVAHAKLLQYFTKTEHFSVFFTTKLSPKLRV